MARNQEPRTPTDKNPAHKTATDAGPIKSPQRTDATMSQPDLPRGSEPENRARSSKR